MLEKASWRIYGSSYVKIIWIYRERVGIGKGILRRGDGEQGIETR